MRRSAWHRARAMVLAVLLGLGLSLSCVQGGAMAAQGVLAADDTHHGQGRCDGCGVDHAGMDAGACLAACGTAAQAVMPAELLMLPSASRADCPSARLDAGGQFPSPDHGPPKLLAFG